MAALDGSAEISEQNSEIRALHATDAALRATAAELERQQALAAAAAQVHNQEALAAVPPPSEGVAATLDAEAQSLEAQIAALQKERRDLKAKTKMKSKEIKGKRKKKTSKI